MQFGKYILINIFLFLVWLEIVWITRWSAHLHLQR